MPNLIPDWLPWMRPAGRLIWAVGLFLIGLIIVLILMRRPKPDRPAAAIVKLKGALDDRKKRQVGNRAVKTHELRRPVRLRSTQIGRAHV